MTCLTYLDFLYRFIGLLIENLLNIYLTYLVEYIDRLHVLFMDASTLEVKHKTSSHIHLF